MSTNGAGEGLGGIAIVGMAGRFPAADSVAALWTNLLAGRECITRFTPEQLAPQVPAALRAHPRYVPARGVIADADRFDAAFFGIAPREALLMDPQQRVFLELCWNALEDAGVDPGGFAGSIGVYAGTSNNGYRKLVEAQAGLVAASGEFATMLANEKDYVATRVAHRLDLRGPAISIHTACSTSLVAIAQAWYALMSWQCDLALAGGINIVVPQESGYLPAEGGMESADGHCRPFDRDADGTVFSSGGAVVVLKRVEEALADGDTIYALIRGVGVNNDGGEKASFTAPSMRGQADAIAMALSSAGVDAGSIGYVEAHGTGTPLGDPIELAALDRVYQQQGAARQGCWLGSVKGNLGHLNAASGVAGLIKATLALHHGKIPPSLHYRVANPEIDFAHSAFKVADHLVDWPRQARARRAGVSSFGVGGTNAHLIVEEAPPLPAAAAGRSHHLLTLSARDPDALRRRAQALADRLAGDAPPDLADVAFTLASGRKPMACRGHVVAANAEQAVQRLRAMSQQQRAATAPKLAFLFPGQGSQHAGMAAQLLAAEPVFRAAFERCCALAARDLARDLQGLILADGANGPDGVLDETLHAQPALFAVEYALAEQWESWGLQPAAMIGHSIGEYVAACRAGVFTLEDAVALVVARGAAMDAQPRGAMLAVRLAAQDLLPRLPDGIEIAARNAPQLTVLSGSHADVDRFAATLAADGVAATRLQVSHAFHSAAMEGALPTLRRAFQGRRLQPPARAFYSCVSGLPITADEATSVEYWCRQLRAPVRFADAIAHVVADGATVLLEVGPGQALTRMMRGSADCAAMLVPSLGAAAHPGNAVEQVQQALGTCWCAGLEVDWNAVYRGQQRRRVPLPTYPFRGERYWPDDAPQVATRAASQEVNAMTSSFEPLSADAHPPAASPPRAIRLAAALRELFTELGGTPLQAQHDGESFLALGFDSLTLTQAALEIERRFGLKIRFRRLLEDLDSVNRLAAQLDADLPTEAAPVAVPMPVADGIIAPAAVPSSAASWASLLENQLVLLGQQTQMLRALVQGGAPTPAAVSVLRSVTPAPAVPDQAGDDSAPADLKARPFGASARIVVTRRNALSAAQRTWLDAFSVAYGQRTAHSKAFAQQHRALMADPRVVTGFNPLWKELTYPITVQRSDGARLWDIDGNEYIDLLNGFGLNFLGYQPAFITAALHAQLDTGIEIGPQHPLTAEVAQLISDMTGMARVAFCNTGSEAVMGAMRIARTVTGRKTIVLFRDSYHGIFDEVIVRGTRMLRSVAAAPGILANAVENVLVLDYGSDEALRIIRERAHELAAVLVEPVQSRHPTLLPTDFVKALRGICTEGGCALIFDEVITGFRMAPGGAQEHYGVRADLATYGKIIGGGLPFAAIAGSALWMDALDGGHWQFGDDSYPEAGVTYFAGTFVRHPLALAAARAALQWIKAQGPTLQADLNARTEAMLTQLNAHFAARQAPLTAIGYSSLWKLRVDEDQPCASLLWYRLRHAGLHVYEQFNCFLSLAHREAEVAQIVAVISAAVDELLDAGVLLPRAAENGYTQVSEQVAGETRAAKLPLTDAQMERWLGMQVDAAIAPAFNEATRLTFRGALDVAALQRAFETVVARHEVLAMRFAEDGSGQEYSPPSDVRLQWLDYSASADAPARLDAWVREQAARPFDLAQPPLLRAWLVRLAADEHALLIVAHHIVLDGWSLGIFTRELALAYAVARQVAGAQLPPADSWRDFVREEQQRRTGAPGQASLAWWLQQYRDVPDPLSLPLDHARPPRTDYRAATVAGSLDATTAQLLRDAARKQRVTLFALLLGGFYALIHRLSGQRDLTCGIPFAGQAVSRFGQTLGDADNTLPLRMVVDPDESFADLLARVHRSLLDAGEHQDVSLARIVNALKLPRDMTRLPLTDVLFNFNPDVSTADWDGVQVEHADQAKTHMTWDLQFHLNEHAGRLDFLVHYNATVFDAATVERWCGYWRNIVAAGTQHPECALADLAMLSQSQRNAMMQEWNATAREYDRAMSLVDLLQRATCLHAQRIAASCPETTLDYRTLDAAARALAQALGARGIGCGAIVGICMPRGTDMLVAVLGVLYSAAAYVPLDPEFPVERLHYMADKTGATHILVTEAALVPPAVAAGRTLLQVQALAAEASERPLPQVRGDDLAYVLFTSGSTGQPKGVRILHRNLVNFLQSMQDEPGFGADDALCAVTTLSFDIAGLELYLPLIAGGRVVIASEEQRRDPRLIADLIERTGCTVLQTTPSLLRSLVATGRDDVLAQLRLFVGGEALALDLANDLAGRCRGLWNLYGPTETTIWSTCARLSPGLSSVPLGKPIANTRIHVLDSRGQPVPPGVIGEIMIAGDGVADGYLGEPELTRQRFVPEPFTVEGRMYRTGDLGSWRDGVLYFHGRVDHQIKIRGFRIEPGDIETAAASFEGVRECVVVARKFADDDLRLVLYAVADGTGEAKKRALREHLRTRLPAYMLPQHIEWLEALPQTPNGKIDRAALPMPARTLVEHDGSSDDGASAGGVGEVAHPPTAADPREAYLAAIWRELIGVTDVRGVDNFFDIGGHSLLAVAFVARVQRETGVKLSLLDIATGTLSSLAALLPQAPGTATQRVTIMGRLRRMFAGR